MELRAGPPTNHPVDGSPDGGAARSPVARRPGVLVVEDHDLIRIMLRSVLEQNGFRVWTAAGGAAALGVYRDQREAIDVVLLEVCLPGLDGPQTLAALRRLEPAVVACFMSASTGGYERAELLDRGARIVFTKPFALKELVERLGALARSRPVPALAGTTT
ncbi:response regulator transcription factor [Frigoriglobus tundricola]|uniref:Response regulatory domain-containing protein n=1 Tax=Frigoriglobus tundricola TaxID=2774151 RepID=A0A6M5YP24_9BACT|nr:response regulator [Frigoriglobus tundricola]QJW94981.1 hypothetical protein FTUN_2507 [Frigoriglobus tundricola]